MSDRPGTPSPFGGVLVTLGIAFALGGALLLAALDTGGRWPASPGSAAGAQGTARGTAVPIAAVTVLPAATPPAAPVHPPPGPTEPWPTSMPAGAATPTAAGVLPVACRPPADWTPVVVQPGETLMLLAMRSLTTIEALRIGNCLADTIVQAGQTIYVPTQPLVTPTVSPQCFPPYGWVFYVVRPGDTLSSIAARFGLSLSQLMFANCRAHYTVYAGERLYVPWTPPPQPAPTATPAPSATPAPTDTLEPPPAPTDTPVPPTATPAPPTPTDTPLPPPTPTDTPLPPPTPTDTPLPPPPPSNTPVPPPPTPTDTPVPPPTSTDTPTPVPTPTDTPEPPPTPTDTPEPPPTAGP